MKKSFFFFCPILFVSVGIMLIKNNSEPSVPILSQRPILTDVIGCAAAPDDKIYADENGKFINILPGWGKHSYNITTENDSAQIYFNQGLSMYYSYHWREAVASFKEAAKFDSTCAMAYWGQALALGPTYNFGYSYKMNANIPSIVEKMNRHSSNGSAKEKDLIAVMNRRYNIADASDKERKKLNGAYADALGTLVTKYRDDLDIKALYTDAVMLIHSWDFWWNDGTPKQWTPQLVQYCKDILEKDPHHPGALHYYIHVTEASRQPGVALASADSLLKLFPGVAHMVHMSSHEYERIGFYAKGVYANEKADSNLVNYDRLAKGLFPVVHASHYFAVDAYCALSGAMYKKAIPKAMTCRVSVEPSNDKTYLQYLYMFPELAMVRLGKWQDILRDTTVIAPGWSYAGVLNDFAKGMAYVNTGSLSQAEKHLKQLTEKQEDKILRIKFSPHSSSPYECSIIAENILRASILFKQKKHNEGITVIKKAILAEDSLLYAEPKTWMLPARQYLGSFFLKLNKPEEAEKVYREDLVWNPGNGWSLLGLYQSLLAQQKKGELKELKALYINSFSEADVIPPGSAY